MKKTFFSALVAVVCLTGYANDNGGIPNTFEKPSFDALKALKATVGKPFSAGYVFVDGHYINPPYTVQRYGTVIRINGIQVTGEIVPWGEFVMTQSGAKVTKSESAPAAEPAPAPAAEPEEPAEEPEEIGNEESSLDDLFADEPTEKKKKPAPKRTVRRPKPQQPVATTSYTFEGEFTHNAKTLSYIKKINAERSKIDMNLRKGGYYFFGSRYNVVAGNSTTSKYVLSKLPPIMRTQTDADAFANALRSAGLSYMPVALMEDLFRNRIGYIMLERRLKADREANQWMNGF